GLRRPGCSARRGTHVPTPTRRAAAPMTTVRQRLRKHLSPLAADTVTTLNLPPVRMGLLTKLNVLTVGLIALTAVTITSFYFWQQWRDNQQQLRAQGRVVLAML